MTDNSPSENAEWALRETRAARSMAQPFKPLPNRVVASDDEHVLASESSYPSEKSAVNFETARYSARRRRLDRSQQQTIWRPLLATRIADLVKQIQTSADAIDIEHVDALRGVHADVLVAEHRLRLHALAWPQGTPIALDLDSQCGLLLLLSPIANSYIPIGTELMITENNLLHSGNHLRWTSHPACLYTQVFGDWEEQFTVQIRLPNSMSVTLPPLTFSQP